MKEQYGVLYVYGMWIQNRNVLEIADVPNTCLCFSCFHMPACTHLYYYTPSYPPQITKSTLHTQRMKQKNVKRHKP
jgi:hypothetical protein